MQGYYATAPGVASVVQVEKAKLEHPTDLVVRVHSVATNPVDFKALQKNPKPRVLGYDASGVVMEVGSAAKGFQVGDEVFYAGDVGRNGSFAEFQAVDSRLVSLKPASLSHTEAAAFPLVSLTAYEAIHETMGVTRENAKGKSIFILPGGGGIGSIAIQLSKLAGLKVITTASREESKAWALQQGADVVIDHRKDLAEEFKAHGLPPVQFALNTISVGSLAKIVPIVAPRAHIVTIVADGEVPKEIVPVIFIKRLSLSWEMMFSRSSLGYEQEVQGEILSSVARLIDSKQLAPLVATHRFKGLAAIEEAQKLQQSGKAVGKIVIDLR